MLLAGMQTSVSTHRAGKSRRLRRGWENQSIVMLVAVTEHHTLHNGQLVHELTIGTKVMQAEHQSEMLGFAVSGAIEADKVDRASSARTITATTSAGVGSNRGDCLEICESRLSQIRLQHSRPLRSRHEGRIQDRVSPYFPLSAICRMRL